MITPNYKIKKNIIEWVNDKELELKIISDTMPHCCVKMPMPSMSQDEMKQIKLKPYINKHRVLFTIFYKDKQYTLLFNKGYDWDGASIPFGARWIIGAKGNPEFLIPSMVHDKLCELHYLIDNDRYLSSLVLRELLKSCGVSKWRCDTMFHTVDNFQKICGKWIDE